MRRRRSRPEEDPPRHQGGRFAWLVGTLPAAVAVTFVVIIVVVLVLALLA